jgi:glycosyltransferase involved in cell wall biosynthesis
VKRVPFVFEISDLWPESIKELGMMQNHRLYRMLEKLELFLYHQAALIIAQTPAFKENLVARGIPTDKIQVILNGVDLEQCKPLGHKDKSLLKQYGLEGRFVVGYLGTHGMAQDLKRIIDMAKTLPEITFLFVGDGAEREEVMAYAQELPNVLFIPQQPKEMMQKWWSLCNIALVPLKNTPLFSTVIPSKIFEAAAFDVPVLLISPQGQAAELVIREKIGVHVLPTELGQGANQITGWAQSKRDLHPLKSVQKYSREKQASEFLKALLTVSGLKP